MLFSFGEAGLLGLQARVVFFPWCGRPHFVGPVFLGLWTNLFLAVHSFGKIVVSDSWGPVGVDAAVGLWKFYTNFAVSIVGRLLCRLSFTSFFTLLLEFVSDLSSTSGLWAFCVCTGYVMFVFWLLFASSPCCPSDVPSFLHGLRGGRWLGLGVDRIRTATTSYQGSGPALTHVVIGYLMAPVYSGQRLNGQVHGMKCDHRLKEWMGNSLCVTVNRKQEVGSRCLLNCMALGSRCLLNCMALYSGAANGGTSSLSSFFFPLFLLLNPE